MFSTIFSILGSVLLLSGAAVWTAVIQRARAISIDVILAQQTSAIPLALQVSAGRGLYMTWAAFVCLSVSIFPYLLAYVYHSFL
jgi:adenine/guanine phosphoribosyltransferase-like PRPP-binding protein